MLFDLRGRGRRTTVRVIYVGLALLLGGGLILFGIGTGGNGGGILNAASNHEGSGGVSFGAQIKKYQRLTREQPNNVAAWEKLVSAQLHEAGGEAYVTRTGVTGKGKELFAQISQSWNRYIALNPTHPNAELAQRMVAVFGEEGLNDPGSAVGVLQIAVAARPNSASLYGALAQYAYKARNARVGDLAAAKAVKLAPPLQKARLKQEFEALKKNPQAGEVLTGTTNGKAYTVKPSPGGGYTGTIPTTTAPAKK
jgi:hypothetical protein